MEKERLVEQKSQVRKVVIDSQGASQRLDNFLFKTLPAVPISRIYRAIRKGEVRVNGGRVKAHYKLVLLDKLRIPPLFAATKPTSVTASDAVLDRLRACILWEGADLIAFNKPAGWAVHGGSGISLGFIEAARLAFPKLKHLELAHRLDRDTSGCLLITKRRSALVRLHSAFRDKTIDKRYLCLVKGLWPAHLSDVQMPLKKVVLGNGERRSRVAEDGRPAHTGFEVLEKLSEVTLLRALPSTGKMHQIRVHTAERGHPVIGDDKYGDKIANQWAKKLGYKGLALHAEHLSFELQDERIQLSAEAPADLLKFLQLCR